MLRHSPLALLVLPAALLLGCPPEETNEEPTPTPEYSYDEQDEGANDSPFDPEEVETDWDPTVNPILTLNGTMDSCGWDVQEDWPYTGDNDNLALTIPKRGILYMELDWSDGSGNLDFQWWRAVPTASGGPDFQNAYESSEMNYDFGDAIFEEDETTLFSFMCKTGSGGGYSMRIEWED